MWKRLIYIGMRRLGNSVNMHDTFGLNDKPHALVNKNWTQILNFFTAKIGFLCKVMDVLIHPCLVGWSVSGILQL